MYTEIKKYLTITLILSSVFGLPIAHGKYFGEYLQDMANSNERVRLEYYRRMERRRIENERKQEERAILFGTLIAAGESPESLKDASLNELRTRYAYIQEMERTNQIRTKPGTAVASGDSVYRENLKLMADIYELQQIIRKMEKEIAALKKEIGGHQRTSNNTSIP